MGEENTTTTPVPGQEPGAEQSTPGQEPTTTSPQVQATDGKTQTDYEKMISDLRKENASHRTRLKKFEDEETQRKNAQLSEAEKQAKQLADIQSQNAELQRQLQEARIGRAVGSVASRLGFADPEDAARFLDIAELDFDDSGNPTNVEALLKAVIKAKPYLAGKPAAPATGGGATNPPRSQAGGTQNVEELLARLQSNQLSSDEYNALPQHLKAQLRAAINSRTNLGSRPI